MLLRFLEDSHRRGGKKKSYVTGCRKKLSNTEGRGEKGDKINAHSWKNTGPCHDKLITKKLAKPAAVEE